MNLTSLSNENINNYMRYLDRMSKSCQKSSKCLIPTLVKGKALDVKCITSLLESCFINHKITPDFPY